ncbi:amino acid ABC transporter membrane protein, PAAT family (TC 3.A.1.3.-) [Clostridium acidisoli DSM 12555]|jgi:polar amino acid transport system permease protein|uniref:Amino acid ABC transporter membrane protein, PAAT family (TC 3.A.1.3.-) n=1 Tax=Clostridium acidisoli DSM 12555 TaxID=1121291 RepID=A0A1W1XXH6_9CLOT|nr:amino acid ABC transporter permease [Clostridium acidisoli]SMC28218.1 amino acid ABC transporter membrane protein, PAAT family (TC 3.A.1.3.-) [Clostridium acidisoli DSM 12555]
MDLSNIKNILPTMLQGSVLTLELTFLSIVFGTIIGVVVAMIKLTNNKIISAIGNFYTWVFRGTPLLLQLVVFYYGFPAINIELSAFQAAIIGLSLNAGAYMAEIIRSGILAIDVGQFEASKALGFTYAQTMKKIVLPQAFRIVIPPVGNQFIGMIKDTSLVSAIALEEVLRKAETLGSSTGNPWPPYITAGILYLLMTTIFTSIFSVVEKKLSVY